MCGVGAGCSRGWSCKVQGGVAQCFSLLFPTGLHAVLVVRKTHAKVELFACVYISIYFFTVCL